MSHGTHRRDFLKQAGLAGVGFWVAGGMNVAESQSPNERLNVAGIGVGGKGHGDILQASKHANVVALCDIDDNTLNSTANEKDKKTGNQPLVKAKKYHDFRKMLEEMDKQIDAVVVSTPDHTHAPASIMAMKMGKHVYCQKPLTHSVHEARMMRDLANQYKVSTQMGNQGTAEDGLRRAVEIIRAGVIGPVKEVHVWTDRPIWPQGAEAILKITPAKAAALAVLHGKQPQLGSPAPIPKHVNWDLFLGPAANRPYDPIYHPFSWRGWWDFGTGALGDMACHTANMAFMALKLTAPTTIEAKSGDINPETYPTWAEITFQFPAREGMPPVKFVWYEGQQDGRKRLPPKELLFGQVPSASGSLLVGEKGVMYSPNDYGAAYKLFPEENFRDYKGPEQSLPRRDSKYGIDEWMKVEWLRAAKGGPAPMSNFNYAATLTEAILLGNVAMRVGKKLEWDAASLKCSNCPEADQYIRPEYRKGWTL